MLGFFSRVVILWEKTKFLNLVRLEREYVGKVYAKVLAKDEAALRERLGQLRGKKNPSAEEKHEASKIDAEITEILQYRQMIDKSVEKEKDLEKQIALFKKRLF